MAEIVVSSVLQKLADPLISEALFLYGVRGDVEWLQRELLWMKCFLKDAEAKRRRGDELRSKISKRVKIGTSLLKPPRPQPPPPMRIFRRGGEYIHISTFIVGLDVHKKEVVDRLLNPVIKRRCVVTIVGIGGLGKTTLAKNVYNDSRIKGKFDVFACITVSQDYKVHEIIKVLVKQMMGKTMAELQSKDADELGEMLRDFLIPRRYLIVLDDVWKKSVWDDLIRAALPEENNGSRVLLTTRLLDVAKSIDPTPYELPFLNEDESWALFLNKAFISYQEASSSRCPKESEGIGRCLVKRCGGLTLALEVLGGILSSKEPNSAAWKRVAEHFDWSSTDDGRDCSKILGLSYDNLPHHHLKSCFLYLGVFPEDSVIEAQHLIELWKTRHMITSRSWQIGL